MEVTSPPPSASTSRDRTLMDVGLLVLRVGIGFMFILHGATKIGAGSETWQNVGSAMQYIGITFGYQAWGFVAGLAELVGGFALMLGLFTRPFAVVLLFVMVVASIMLIASGQPSSKWSHPVELGVVFVAIALMGPGRYSLRQAIVPLRDRWYA